MYCKARTCGRGRPEGSELSMVYDICICEMTGECMEIVRGVRWVGRAGGGGSSEGKGFYVTG